MKRPKVIGGIPTHARTTAVPVAERMLSICDEVLIVAQCTELETENPKILIENRDTPCQLDARNDIIQYAREAGADWVLVSDDDLSFKPELLQRLLDTAQHWPFIGGFCSQSSLYYYYSRKTQATIYGEPVDWYLTVHPSQLWLIRMETLNEIGDMRLEAMQDAEWGLRGWTAGWASARLHAGKDFVHQPIISRMNKTVDQGGQTPEVRAREMPISINYMHTTYSGPGGVLKSMRLSKPGAKRTHTTRFNWANMIANLQDRWGEIGYEEYWGLTLKKVA